MSNSSIIRQLKRLKKTEEPSKGKVSNLNNGFTLLLSVIAIIISGFSLYFQFFYEKYELKVNFISATFEDQNELQTLNYKIVYHNKSNQNATVLRNTVVFYQDSTDIENKGIYFLKDEPYQTNKEEFDPVVLEINKQVYREINQPIDFDYVFYKENINFKDTIRIALSVGFINEFGSYSTNFIPMGWVKLDSINKPKYYSFTYVSKNLISETYRSSSYRTED